MSLLRGKKKKIIVRKELPGTIHTTRKASILLDGTHYVVELNWYKGNKITVSIMLICGNNI